MPLKHGSSRATFSHNVKEMMEHGHPQKQAVAAAYQAAGEKKMKKHAYGGRACMACGGVACKLGYEHLRDQVEKERMGGDGIEAGMAGHGLGRMAMGGEVPRGPAAKADDAGMAYGPGAKADIMKGMMKPLGRYAKGGSPEIMGNGALAYMADGGGVGDDPNAKTGKAGLASAFDQPSSLSTALGKAYKSVVGDSSAEGSQKKAHGGEIEDMDDDSMMKDAAAGELMEAMKSGNKQALKDAFMAMMHECMESMEGEE